MKLGLRMVWRPLCVGVLMLMNYPSQNVQAQPTCWDCKWCSDSETCCPSGTKWDTCTQGTWGQTCWVTQGACSGGAEGSPH
jgi:hypothetical protein